MAGIAAMASDPLCLRGFALVAQWTERLTSDYPGPCAVALCVERGAKRAELSALFSRHSPGCACQWMQSASPVESA